MPDWATEKKLCDLFLKYDERNCKSDIIILQSRPCCINPDVFGLIIMSVVLIVRVAHFRCDSVKQKTRM